MSGRINDGLKQHQSNKEVESQLKILSTISYDEDWHRYLELQEKTALSTKTLSKQLNALVDLKLIERDEKKGDKYKYIHPQIESTKYPFPVYYRLNPIFANAFRGYRQETFDKKIKAIRANLMETKNPLEILRDINTSNNITLLGILIFLKENKRIDTKLKRLLLEYLVWNEYKTLTWKLLEETERIIDAIDLKTLVGEA